MPKYGTIKCKEIYNQTNIYIWIGCLTQYYTFFSCRLTWNNCRDRPIRKQSLPNILSLLHFGEEQIQQIYTKQVMNSYKAKSFIKKFMNQYQANASDCPH